MAKYLALWEVDPNYLPIDPKEKKALIKAGTESVIEHMKSGMIKDWGEFGVMKGYAIIEASNVDLYKFVASFMPGYKATVHAVMSAEEVIEAVESM